MTDTVLRFNFKTTGSDTPVQALADIAKQAKAARSSLEQFRTTGNLTEAATNGAIALARAFNLSFNEARELAKGLNLTEDAAARAVSAIAQLRAVNATTAERFGVLRREVGLTAKQFYELDQRVGQSGQTISDFQRIAGTIASLGLAQQLQSIAGNVLQTGLQFERLRTVLKTLLGEGGAGRAFEEIQTFAANTPFQVEEVLSSFISLKQRGLEPTTQTLTRLGDIASSQGKSLQQFTEAILDATQGENERLKEFGIGAQVAGDKVTFSFRGINKTVEKTPQAIQNAILSFGELEGVAGGMAALSNTLGGQFSNLQDNTARLSDEFFRMAQGPAILVVKAANDFLNTFNSAPPILKKVVLGTAGLGAAFVAATTAVAAFNLAGGVATVIQIKESVAIAANTVVKGANAIATFLLALVTGKLTAAQVAATVAIAANTAAFAGAAASIALVVDTYNSVTGAAAQTREGTKALEGKLQDLAEINAKVANQNKETASTLNVEQQAMKNISDNLSPFQKALDVVRESINGVSLGLLDLSTAPEAAFREQQIAFAELNDSLTTVSNQGFAALANANNLSTEQLKGNVAAIDAAITAQENAAVATESDAKAKEINLRVLKKLREELDKFVPTTEKVNTAIRQSQQEFDKLQSAANAEKLRGQLRILEEIEAGHLDAGAAAKEQAALEQQANQDIVDNLQKQRATVAAQLNQPRLEEEQKKVINTELLKLDEKLATAQISVVKGRIDTQKGLEQERVADLEKANSTALAKIQLAEQLRLNAIASSLTDEQDINRARLESTRQTIAAQLAEAQKLQKGLAGEKGPEGEAKRLAGTQRIAELTGALIENERSLQKQALEEKLAGLEDEAAARKQITSDQLSAIATQTQAESLQSKAKLAALATEKQATDLITQSLDQQQGLLEAQNKLQEAQRNLQSTRANIEVENLNKALEIRKRLTSEQLSPQIKAALQEQLKLLAGNRQSEAEILERKLQREAELAAIKKAQLAAELLAERQRADLAAKRLEIEAQIAQIAVRQSQLQAQIATTEAISKQKELEAQLAGLQGDIQGAQATVEALKTSGGSKRDIAQAEGRVRQLQGQETGLAGQLSAQAQQISLAKQNEELTAQQNAAVLAQLENRRAIAQIDQATLTAQQQAKVLQFEQEDSARKMANHLTVAEAASRGVKVGLPTAAATPSAGRATAAVDLGSKKVESQLQKLIDVNQGLSAQILRLGSRTPLQQQNNYYGSGNNGGVDLRSQNL